MPELLQTLLVSIGGAGALLAVFLYVGRSVFQSFLDKDLEKFKTELQRTATEHQIVFSRLHEKRADVIAELYGLLVTATWEAQSFASPMEWVGEPDKKTKFKEARGKESSPARHRLHPIAQLVLQRTTGQDVYDGRYDCPIGPQFPRFRRAK